MSLLKLSLIVFLASKQQADTHSSSPSKLLFPVITQLTLCSPFVIMTCGGRNGNGKSLQLLNNFEELLNLLFVLHDDMKAMCFFIYFFFYPNLKPAHVSNIFPASCSAV